MSSGIQAWAVGLTDQTTWHGRRLHHGGVGESAELAAWEVVVLAVARVAVAKEVA